MGSSLRVIIHQVRLHIVLLLLHTWTSVIKKPFFGVRKPSVLWLCPEPNKYSTSWCKHHGGELLKLPHWQINQKSCCGDTLFDRLHTVWGAASTALGSVALVWWQMLLLHNSHSVHTSQKPQLAPCSSPDRVKISYFSQTWRFLSFLKSEKIRRWRHSNEVIAHTHFFPQ